MFTLCRLSSYVAFLLLKRCLLCYSLKREYGTEHDSRCACYKTTRCETAEPALWCELLGKHGYLGRALLHGIAIAYSFAYGPVQHSYWQLGQRNAIIRQEHIKLAEGSASKR